MTWEKTYTNTFGNISAVVYREQGEKNWSYSLSRDGKGFYNPPGNFITAKRAMAEAESVAAIVSGILNSENQENNDQENASE